MISRVCADMIRKSAAADLLATYQYDGSTDEAAIFTSRRVPDDFANDAVAGVIDKPWVRIQEVSSRGETGTRTRRAHTVTARVIVTGPQNYNDEDLYDIARKISRVIDRGADPDPVHDQVDVHGIWCGMPVDGGADEDGFERVSLDVEALIYEPV